MKELLALLGIIAVISGGVIAMTGAVINRLTPDRSATPSDSRVLSLCRLYYRAIGPGTVLSGVGLILYGWVTANSFCTHAGIWLVILGMASATLAFLAGRSLRHRS